MDNIYDVIIIGSGPAGISTSLYTSRGNLKTLVISKGYGALKNAEIIENYYGEPKGISGKELHDKGIMGAKNLGVSFKEEEVLDVTFEDDFLVTTTKDKYKGRFIVVAQGKERKSIKVDGLKEFEGKGVSYCAICDAFFYRGKEVAVVGDGEYAYHEIETLLKVAKKVTLLTNGNTPKRAFGNIEVDTKDISKIVGDSRVEKVVFEDGTERDIQGIFIAIGSMDAASLSKKLGVMTENGNIVVDENMRTNIPNVYAVGDCIGGLLQISKCVGDGAIAGVDIIKNSKKS